MGKLRKVIILGCGGIGSTQYKELFDLAKKHDMKMIAFDESAIGEPPIKTEDPTFLDYRLPKDYSKLFKEAKPIIEPKGSKYHK